MPMMFFQVADLSAVAALVGEAAFQAVGTREGHVVLHAQQAPGAAGKIHRIVAAGRHGHEGAACVMGGREHHVAAEAHPLGNLRQNGAQVGAGHLRPMENARGNARRRQHLLIPVPGCGVHTGGGGFGIFVGLPPGQAVVQIVGNHEEILRLVQLFPRRGHELVHGVEGLLGNARAPVQLGEGHGLLQLGVHALGAAVPVGHGIPQHLPRLVQQDIIHPPGINAHGNRDFSRGLTGGHALEHMLPQAVHLPAQVAVALHHDIIEAVDFLQDNLSFLQVGQDVPPARGAHIHRQNIGHCVSLLRLCMHPRTASS